jgi:hypothetical protein
MELMLKKQLWKMDLWLLDPIQRVFEETLDIVKVRRRIIVTPNSSGDPRGRRKRHRRRLIE